MSGDRAGAGAIMAQEPLLGDRSLADTLADLEQKVRGNPGDARLRIFLFQLLSVLGQWERALTQLHTAGELDAGALAMVQTYREAIACEALRKEVFEGRRSPLVFGEPAPWVALVLEALRLGAQGESAASQEMRGTAFEQAEAVRGRARIGRPWGEEDEGEPLEFEWIADADPRLGPMLEAIVNGRYYWIPFEKIRRIVVEKPADLRDLVWTPVHFVWSNGGESVGLVPTRYPGSESDADDAIRLGRRTEWRDAGDDLLLPRGQRMLATDGGEYPIMDLRTVELDGPPAAAGPARDA